MAVVFGLAKSNKDAPLIQTLILFRRTTLIRQEYTMLPHQPLPLRHWQVQSIPTLSMQLKWLVS